LENLEKVDKFLDTYDHPKLNQEDINHLNRSITSNEIEEEVKSFPKKKSPEPERLTAEFNQTFKRRSNTNTPLTFPQNRKGRNTA
jgi:hypothetical protein